MRSNSAAYLQRIFINKLSKILSGLIPGLLSGLSFPFSYFPTIVSSIQKDVRQVGIPNFSQKQRWIQRELSANGVDPKTETKSDKRVVMQQGTYHCVIMITVSQELCTNESHITKPTMWAQVMWLTLTRKGGSLVGLAQQNISWTQGISYFCRKIKIHCSITFINILHKYSNYIM